MKLMEIGKMDQQELDLALQEIKLLSELDHKHVLSYVTCFQQDGCLCIITEFCPNGDLSGRFPILYFRYGKKKKEILC